VVKIFDGLLKIFNQGFMVGDVVMVEKLIFQLFIGRFDHGVRELDIALSDEMLNRWESGCYPFFYNSRILGTIIGDKLAGCYTSGNKISLPDLLQVIECMLGSTFAGDPIAQNGSGKIIPASSISFLIKDIAN
jgi:hypothetical protein